MNSGKEFGKYENNGCRNNVRFQKIDSGVDREDFAELLLEN